jgi:tetratricopeptide (TPR) repeat protein
MLNQENGWQITISAMKDFKTAIFGVGSGNFSIAASKFRPESLYPLLSSSKTIVLGSNLYLQFLTEYGLLTFMAFMIILIFIMRNLFTRINIDNAVLFFGLFISILLQLFCPPSIVGLFFFFLFLAFFDKKSKNIFFYNLSGHKIIKSVAVFLLILDLFLFILFSKNYLSEVFYHRAIVSYNADSKNSYNNINIALFLNSKNPYYHLYLAGLYKNDAILLSKLSDLSPENNEKMRNLITLSINEFKYASLLAPSNPVLYFELGKTYLDFMNVVRKSVDEAIKNLNSALEIDRTNPNYHFYLGKAYIANGKYFLAQKELELATLIDPTFVNAYYNLYYSFLKQGLMNQALAALTKTKELLSPTHHQYDKISAELLEFEKFGKENLPFENPKQNFGSLESVGQ